MRIGIDIRAVGQQRTGDETYTLQLVRALAKADTKNHYFLYTDINDKSSVTNIQELLNIKNKKFKVVSVGPRGKLLWTSWSLPRQAKKDNLDILHVQYISPLFLSKNIKLITTIHDISFARYPKFIGIKDLLLLKMLIKPSLKRADGIIAVSKFTKDEIVDVYGTREDKITVVYNGGVAEEFKQHISEQDVLAFRDKYGIMKPYLLYIGTLQPRKNIPFLIEAFVGLKDKYKNDNSVREISLVIRGKRDGHNYDRGIDNVLAKVKKENFDIYKQIKFIDYISNEELPLIFKAAKALCFSSLYEGFGLPLLEAMTVGSPVVISDDSCFPEVSGGVGVLYRSGDYDDWGGAVNKFLKDAVLQKRLRKDGIERAKLFSWDKNAEETIELYKKNKNKRLNK